MYGICAFAYFLEGMIQRALPLGADLHGAYVCGLHVLQENGTVHVAAEAAAEVLVAHFCISLLVCVVNTAYEFSFYRWEGSGCCCDVFSLGKDVGKEFHAVKAEVSGIVYADIPTLVFGKILQSAAACFISIGFAGRVGGGGFFVAAPVLEHFGYMDAKFLRFIPEHVCGSPED